MKLILLICVLGVSLASPATNNSQPRPPHQSCTWCHVPRTSVQAVSEQTRKAALPINSSTCLSCHDGNLGPALSDVHAIHIGRFPNEPQTCLDCHNPHDRTGSYMQLRGKHGPETEQTWMLDFCRDCHTDH
jgi:5-methylcytosine-specific restriction endonuclease McrA